MKKILMLNYEFPPLGGGGGRVSLSLAKGFIEKGYAVDVITSRFGRLPAFETIDGMDVYRVKIFGRRKKQTATFITMLSFLFSAFICGTKLCLTNQYCFINTHFVLPTGPLGFLISKLFHLKNILSIHGGDIYDPSKASSPHNKSYLRLIVRFLLNQADRIVAQSTNTKDNAIRYYRPDQEIDVIPLSYEPFDFSPMSRRELGLDDEKCYLISVGRVIKRKGFDFLIRSLALLDDDVELIIVGNGNEKPNLQQTAGELGLLDRVHFPGEVSEARKFQYLSNSDVYVLSSLHEGFGIVLQEAMQVGLPIVSTNHGGQTDIINQNVNGLLVEVGEVDELAEAINQLIKDEALRHRMAVNNVASLKKFSTSQIVDDYLELIS